MASLRLPTLKQLEKVSANDALEWLASLESELKRALAEAFPEDDTRAIRKIESKLRRLQERSEEYRASRHA